MRLFVYMKLLGILKNWYVLSIFGIFVLVACAGREFALFLPKLVKNNTFYPAYFLLLEWSNTPKVMIKILKGISYLLFIPIFSIAPYFEESTNF